MEPEFYKRLVGASRDGLWVVDATGTTVFANRQLTVLLGRTEEELIGAPAAAYFDGQDPGGLAAHLAELASAPDDHPGEDNREVQLVRADGEILWVLASHSPIRDDEGRRIGWLHRLSENTTKKRLLDSLRDRESLLAAAQSIAQIGSWEWDVATDRVTWSDQLYRIYNVTPEEFEATYAAFLEFIHPDDRGMVESAVASIFAGEDEFAWDGRVLPRGGDVRWVRGLGRVERDAEGRPVKMGGTAQDITERVLADQLAADATRRLHVLQTMATAANQTNSLGEAVALCAVGLPEFTNWLPISDHRFAADGSPLTVTDLSSATPGWRPPPDETLAARCRDSGRLEHTPTPGRETTHSIVAFPVLLDGVVTCVLEVLADETPPDEHSRNLIEQVAQQLTQVAQREAAALQLADARDQAMEASRLKSEFLATMSHEIRTPMNGVIGLNDLLLRTDLDVHQRRLAEGLQGAGLTLLAIINDILDLSKIEAGKLELEEVDFDVRAVFEQAADLLAGPAREKGLELVVSCHPAVPDHLRGDPGRLGQVLVNLGSNALKFTEEGEVSIRARVEDETDEGIVLRVDVTDTGVGIDPTILRGLFDAFTQADPSTTRRHGGTGLGLAICRELVAALGGTIEVDSAPGRGSTFSFSALLGRADDVPAPRAPTSDPSILRGRRALVVDDNATNRLILDEQLAAWEMTIVSVGTAETAMAALRRALADDEPFDVVLLDLLLPDGDGLALGRAITAGSAESPPQLLLLSSGEHVDTGAARASGIARTLSKPVRHSQLLEALATALASTPAPQQVARQRPAPRHPGRRVLVVEDNEVNQMVAVGLLEASGYVAEVARDGLEAIASLEGDHGYDAVLMDCRMPRLDGFDATRAIRAAEPPGRHVPIIAMTASALEGENERCLAAGMDDFLTKPVDPDRLITVVDRWVKTEPAGAASPAGAPSTAAPPGTAVIDRERMTMLDGMRREGTSLFERASANFAANAETHLAGIRAAVADADAQTLIATAHKLVGSATNLGLPALGEAAAALEIAGRRGTTLGAPALLDALEAEMARALAALAEIRVTGLDAGPAPVSQ